MFKDFDLRVVRDFVTGKVNLVEFYHGDPVCRNYCDCFIYFFAALNPEDSSTPNNSINGSDFKLGYPYIITREDVDKRHWDENRPQYIVQTQAFSDDALKNRQEANDNKLVLMPIDYSGVPKCNWEDIGGIKDFLPANVYDNITDIIESYSLPGYDQVCSLFNNILTDLQQLIRDKVDGKEVVLTAEFKHKLKQLCDDSDGFNSMALKYRAEALIKCQEEYERVERDLPF